MIVGANLCIRPKFEFMKKILVICGPTASGKTALALRLAQMFPADLLAADSRQVYQGMDIGTGKDIPTIYGYDLIKPNQNFNVAQYCSYALYTIKHIWESHRLPIIVGGTGLYLKSLFFPPDTLNFPINLKLRHSLEKLSVYNLQQKLTRLNIDRFNQMNSSDQSNPRRLIRAIEVLSSPRSLRHNSKPQILEAEVLWLGLMEPLNLLDHAIQERVKARATGAFTTEIRQLNKLYPHFKSLPAATATGYQEWMAYLGGKLSKDRAIDLWATHERQYARRQLTWFKKIPQIEWYRATIKSEAAIVQKVKTWYA
jgi:tRNA dimethylallyltransferase